VVRIARNDDRRESFSRRKNLTWNGATQELRLIGSDGQRLGRSPARSAVTGGCGPAFPMTEQAAEAAQANAEGKKKKIKKIRKSVKPKLKKLPGQIAPKYERRAVEPVSVKRNEYKIIRGPVTSDKASRKLEDENTMVFWVDLRATKRQIRAAVKKLYHANALKISTLVTSKCLKKAYVRLPPSVEAMNIANEMA
jgi:large subunit ribosomal protein L23Ae